MALIPRLPLVPHGSLEVSDSLAVFRDEGRVVFFNAGGPIFSCDEHDRVGLRLAAVTVVEQGLAGRVAIAGAVGVHRTTLFRDLRKVREHGVEGLMEKRRGPKGPHTLTPEVQSRAQGMLDRGASIRATASSVGVSERGLRHAIQRGLLRRLAARGRPPGVSGSALATTGVGPRERAVQDQSCEAGVGVKRMLDRALASVGRLAEAAPSFVASEAVSGAGVLLALPALLEEGLLEVAEKVYGRLRNGFFGLCSVLLTLAFMALLRVKTPEQLTGHAPGELGLLLGLDRVPEVKTLRRKLREMGERTLARTFTQQLTERWAQAAPGELALLYIDGHVRPYHGRKHTLPKHHVQQRGRPMPGTKDFHVHDRRADPLLFVTAEATESLLATLEATLLPQVRALVGARRRVTITFDREGWSPRLFAKWKKEKFDVLTYRKGKQVRWQERFFTTVRGKVGGQTVEYRLAERRVRLPHGLRVREIRRLTDDGHQTAVITTNETLGALAIAHRMFSRWRQENFFRYMRQEFALDHLCTHEVEPADPKRLVTSPERTAIEKKLRVARSARNNLLDRRMDLTPGKTLRIGKRAMSAEELIKRIRQRDQEIDKLVAQRAALPPKVPIDTVLASEKIVQIERERKVLVDAIKLTAYRAESSLARLVEPFFARHQEEARKFLKSIFTAVADILPEPQSKTLTVRFHGLANPRATRALGELCAIVNEDAPVYPGTDLRLHFEAPMLQK